jgi:crossover junction endodeoxyribonuclease RuvC
MDYGHCGFLMRVLGVDPGLRVTGYGVIETSGGSGPRGADLVEAGMIRTGKNDGIAERLRKIHDALAEVVEELKPDVLAIEKLYAHYNHPATAILMGHARGVVCLVSGTCRIPLASVASTHVKKAVTGRGHAGKHQVQRMVQHALGLKQAPEPPDVADALAVALAYVSTLRKHR